MAAASVMSIAAFLSARRHATLACAALVALWAALLFSDLGGTLHTVDNIRDFRVASAIASGEAAPLVSQPFAGRWQLPPIYFYAIALPLRVAGTETSIFIFTAFVALAAVALLATVLRRRFGSATAVGYLAVALPAHGVVIFPGVSNSALAFALVSVFLAAWLGSPRVARAGPLIMMASGFAAVATHPSAFAIVGPALLLALVFQPSVRNQPSAWIGAGVLGGGLGLWLFLHGLAAPEAQAAELDGASLVDAIIGRLFSLDHWIALWSTPWTHLRALPDLASGAFAGIITAAQAIMLLAMVAGGVFAWRSPDRDVRLLLISVLLMTVTATAAVSAWGFWYLDALWPPAAVLAGFGACGLWRRLASGPHIPRVLLGATAAACLLAPAVALKLLVAGSVQYRVFAHGLFLPPGNQATLLEIPLARELLRYRSFVAASGGCQSWRFTGIEEWWLRDLTLRLTVHGCPRSTQPPPAVAPVRYRLERALEPPAEAGGDLVFGGFRLRPLPDATVRIGDSETGEVYGWRQGARYSYYLPEGLARGLPIDARIDSARTATPAVAAPGLMLLFRCLETDPATLARALDGHGGGKLVAERMLGPIAFRQYRLPLADEASARVALAEALPQCDLAAWVE